MDDFKEMIQIEKEFGSVIKEDDKDAHHKREPSLWKPFLGCIQKNPAKFRNFIHLIANAKIKQQTNLEIVRARYLESY